MPDTQRHPRDLRSARHGQVARAPRIESDNPDGGMHEHPTGWPDEIPLEALPPHPGCDPVEVSTERRDAPPERRRRSPRRAAHSRPAR
ncbi:MAG TPA: hypothetical protein VF814_13640 [Casimicrobiaceae bacterium]